MKLSIQRAGRARKRSGVPLASSTTCPSDKVERTIKARDFIFQEAFSLDELVMKFSDLAFDRSDEAFVNVGAANLLRQALIALDALIEVISVYAAAGGALGMALRKIRVRATKT